MQKGLPWAQRFGPPDQRRAKMAAWYVIDGYRGPAGVHLGVKAARKGKALPARTAERTAGAPSPA